MTISYVDISHVNAPYKASYMSGFGADAAVPETVTVEASGVRVFKPEVASAYLMLASQMAVYTEPFDLKVFPTVQAATAATDVAAKQTDADTYRLSDWIAYKNRMGKSVLLSVTPLPSNSPTKEPVSFLKAISPDQEIGVAGPGALAFYAVLSRPKIDPSRPRRTGDIAVASAGGISPLWIGLGVAAVVGGLYLAFGKKSRAA